MDMKRLTGGPSGVRAAAPWRSPHGQLGCCGSRQRSALGPAIAASGSMTSAVTVQDKTGAVSRRSTPLPITRPPPTAQRRGKGGPEEAFPQGRVSALPAAGAVGQTPWDGGAGAHQPGRKAGGDWILLVLMDQPPTHADQFEAVLQALLGLHPDEATGVALLDEATGSDAVVAVDDAGIVVGLDESWPISLYDD